MVFNLLYHLTWQIGLLKRTKKLVLSIFRCFPQVFGRVEGWLITELHKIIRVSHAGAIFPNLFFSFFVCFMGEVGSEQCSKS